MFLDIGIGIIVAICASYFSGMEMSFLLAAFSIFFALLPDADFLYFYTKRHDTKHDHKHRDIIHYPLLYLPIGTILLWIMFGKVWALVFLASSFFHFLHDSIAIGWGIKWLYPFSKNNYSFFYLYSRKLKKGLRGLVFVFNENNLPELVREHGDPNWVQNIYYKWHPIAVVEFGFFVFSVALLLFNVYL